MSMLVYLVYSRICYIVDLIYWKHNNKKILDGFVFPNVQDKSDEQGTFKQKLDEHEQHLNNIQEEHKKQLDDIGLFSEEYFPYIQINEDITLYHILIG